ncbi:MAG TPA: NAD(+) synthase [Candidatus Krumholzibacteria bacterium]|jgi:NAD+ synthase
MCAEKALLRGGDPLLLDLATTRARLCDFLRSQVLVRPRHRGYVVGISGGIDSAVAAALCVEALGAARVFAVLLPERESQPEGVALARRLVEHLGLSAREFDISDALEVLDVYRGREAVVRRLFPDFQSGWPYRLVFPGDLKQSKALSIYHLEVFKPDGSCENVRPDPESLRELQALTNVKQRLRMACLYREAEARGHLVCGTTNHSELALGFFVRHGDGGVDLEPLAALYKTQIRALARAMGLPSEIVDQAPSPDTWSAPVNDREFYLRLDYGELDRILLRVERGDASGSIAAELSLETEFVERVRDEIERRQTATARNRELPSCPPQENL